MLKDWFSLIFLDKEIKEDVLFLKKIDVFKNFTTWQLKKITTILYRRTYLKNEFIYKKGEPAKMVCFLKSGKIKLFDEKTESIVEPYILFGERSLLCANDYYLKNSKAVEKSDVYIIHKEDLEKLMEKDTSIGFKIVKTLLENFYNRI
jgi:CRP/FNR family transcriptional regulator